MIITRKMLLAFSLFAIATGVVAADSTAEAARCFPANGISGASSKSQALRQATSKAIFLSKRRCRTASFRGACKRTRILAGSTRCKHKVNAGSVQTGIMWFCRARAVTCS